MLQGGLQGPPSQASQLVMPQEQQQEQQERQRGRQEQQGRQRGRQGQPPQGQHHPPLLAWPQPWQPSQRPSLPWPPSTPSSVSAGQPWRRLELLGYLKEQARLLLLPVLVLLGWPA